MPTDPLHATPEDPTPDSGPLRQGGTLVIFAALVATFCALFGAGVAFQASRPALIVPALLVFCPPAVWWWRCVWIRWRDRTPLLHSHSVLTGTLGFDLVCTCRGVAPTAFFHPDRGVTGDDPDLFVFLENYTSRQRVVEVRVGPHPGLGLPHPHIADLHLAAGQAAVYRLTLRPDPTLAPGRHDLPVVLRVQGPQGAGRRLPGTRRHLYDIWHTRFAAPFTLEPTGNATMPSATTDELPPPTYVSLASVSEPRSDLHGLQGLAVPAWLKSEHRKAQPPPSHSH